MVVVVVAGGMEELGFGRWGRRALGKEGEKGVDGKDDTTFASALLCAKTTTTCVCKRNSFNPGGGLRAHICVQNKHFLSGRGFVSTH